MKNIVQDFRSERTGSVREHADMGGQIVIDLHKTKRNNAVKPDIGDTLNGLRIAIGIDFSNQCRSLALLKRGENASANFGSTRLADVAFFNAVLISSLGNLLVKELMPFHGKLLNLCFVHLLMLL